jgi:hypothetical protein
MGICPCCGLHDQKLDKTIGQPGIAVAICGHLDIHNQLAKHEVGLQYSGSSFRVCRKCAYRAHRAKLAAQIINKDCMEFSTSIKKNGKTSTSLPMTLRCGDSTTLVR